MLLLSIIPGATMQRTSQSRSSGVHTSFLVAALVGLWCMSGTADSADLKVTINNLRGPGGVVYVALYDSADTFPQQGKGIAGQYFPATDTTASAAFLNLKPGHYALTVYHDENGNGHLDTNLLGVPVERYGFSRDASGSFGPPSFDSAMVDLQDDASITINLH
jgi:uncharacterized protein (DUF2141 family)